MKKKEAFAYLILALAAIVLGESWLLGRFFGESIFPPIPIAAIIFLSGIAYCIVSLRQLAARDSLLFPAVFTAAVILAWGAIWQTLSTESPNLKPSAVSMSGSKISSDEWNSAADFWVRKGERDACGSHSPPGDAELDELSRGNEDFRKMILSWYESGYKLSQCASAENAALPDVDAPASRAEEIESSN